MNLLRNKIVDSKLSHWNSL